jgi:hypothetical protein
MTDWTDPIWLAGVYGWIQKRVLELGLRIVDPIEQPHIRPWSTVLRVPTDRGALWFKANVPALAHEAAVVGVLARRRPDCVPDLLAADYELGWMLMADGGDRLREVVERDHDLGRWRELLPRYARLQLDLAEHADELVALGAPDRRLETLADQYGALLGRLDNLPIEDTGRFRRLQGRVAEMCNRLACYGIPETIQHDDLHDGQVFAEGDRYLFFDWGDACVSHPFFTMAVSLEGCLAWGLDDVEGSEDIRPYRDAYLRPFERLGTREELEDAHAIALRLGWICRALNVEMLAQALGPPHRQEHLDGVRVRLQLFAARLDS